ncbi:MAG: hypothetical protein EOS72_03035 [Mesorhizobium sp.]|uniref:hypothetical protein n=1 Tax=Mesorhizobium sp. TaxID=1871066 RepID=UPI000FEA6850|nr:hypothetical protein [Mesorhizobium sp.]RWC91646.1 MAG: hypothetical protein EOS72_03035 [Mesorhizobium sp.]
MPPVDNVTANRNWPLPNGDNDLAHDVARLIGALQAADVDVAGILTLLVQKAPLLNTGLLGSPTAPSPPVGDNSNRIATTAWARLYFADFVGAAPAALDTIAELAAALQNNPDIINQLVTSIGTKAPLASPGFSGSPTAPTQIAGDVSTKLANTQFVDVSFAKKASPAFTGTPTAPTAAAGTNTQQLATTAFVKAAIDVVLGGVSAAFDTLSEIATALGLKAPLASPGFTGIPTAPTAALGTNTTQLATTAFVAALPITKFFESAQLALANGGTVTVAHGLGVQPKMYIPYLQCITAEYGYSSGDEVAVAPSYNANGYGIAVVPDATNLVARYGSGAGGTFVSITRKDNGSSAAATNANWRLVLRAWA